jgi:hypothetical protein
MLAPRLPDRLTALRAWSARHAVRARGAVEWAWGKVSHWPWPRIGVWAGGVFGLLVLAMVLLFTFADWNALKGPISRMASTASGREVVIQGDLEVHPWSWTPEIRVTQLKIGNPARYRARGDFATFNEVNVAVRLLPLFIGRFDVVRLDLNGAALALYRNAAGDGNWMPDPRADRRRAINLPAIRQFSLRGGRLQFVDELRKLTLDAAFTSNEIRDAADPGHFRLHGDGRINGQTFIMTLTGAPLLNVRRDRPYAFNADITAGGTHLIADGAIRRPFDLSAWNANVRGSGPDLADLYPLTGLALPNTPPYNLTGRLDRAGVRYGMTGLRGRVGDSDLRGGFTATRKVDGRLLLDGDFTTASLDFDDLMAVLGGAPSTAPGETASDGQRAMAANLRTQDRLLPDARLDISRVRNMDARVSYRAAHVRSDRVPLRGLALDLTLDHGLLRADPLTLELSQGRLAGAMTLNARQDTPHVDLDMRLTNARLESVFAVQGRPAIEGRLTGRARLSGDGASVRQVAANADGDVTLVTPHGEVRESLAELTGINVTRGLGLLLSHDQSTIGIRCGVAHFRVENGIAHARSIVLDTDTMLITGEGSVSLRDESLDLRIHGEPKEVRLVRFAAPITIQGRLRSPHVGVDTGRGITQGGAAALLASLVTPLAAILPFVDAGLADDADCSALLAGRPQPPRAD